MLRLYADPRHETHGDDMSLALRADGIVLQHEAEHVLDDEVLKTARLELTKSCPRSSKMRCRKRCRPDPPGMSGGSVPAGMASVEPRGHIVQERMSSCAKPCSQTISG